MEKRTILITKVKMIEIYCPSWSFSGQGSYTPIDGHTFYEDMYEPEKVDYDEIIRKAEKEREENRNDLRYSEPIKINYYWKTIDEKILDNSIE